MFYQQVSQEIFESLLIQRFKVDHNEAPDQSGQDRLTNEEGNTVNYVGGYVVGSLKGKTKNKGQLDVLEKLSDHSTSFEAQRWAKTVDLCTHLKIFSCCLVRMPHGGILGYSMQLVWT